MTYISDILYWISTGLLVPVVVLLILLFVRALLLIGNFFGQYLATRRTQAVLTPLMNTLTASSVEALAAQLPQGKGSLVVSYMRRILAVQQSAAQVEHLLAEFETEADGDLGTSRTLAKMGPMLGLMGTLIPMGPALVGLAAGDIASMAYNMQVAFATTVIGLFASAIGFVTQQVKQRWYLQDMNRLEFLAALLKERHS